MDLDSPEIGGGMWHWKTRLELERHGRDGFEAWERWFHGGCGFC